MTSSPPPPVPRPAGRRLASLLLALGALGWAAIAVATQTIPSPAREIRFLLGGRALPGSEVRCHGAYFVDADRVWSECERTSSGVTTEHLARLDVSTGVATLLGPLQASARGLRGVARGSGPTRAFVVGSDVIEVRGDALRALGGAGLTLGIAVIDEAVEVVDHARHPTLEVRRYEAGRLVDTHPLPALTPRPGRITRAEYAARERDGWHVVYSERPATAPSLPVELALFERGAQGEARPIQTLPLGAPSARRLDSGEVSTDVGVIQGGALLGGFTGQREAYLRRGGAFERVALEASDFLDPAGGVVRADGHLGRLFVDVGGREFWLDGERIGRATVDGRSSALRVGGRTGPALTPSFWIEIAPRVFPREGGGYVIIGGLEQAIVRVGPDLARADALSFGERLARLFVEDRAKRNADFFGSAGVLRSLTVPFAMLLPWLGLAGLAMASRRPRLVVGASASALALALLGVLPFVTVLRFYW